jgi:UDPglucose 6-dehydrogenase
VPYRLTVLGTGYLGATHAACMAELGFEVLGLDVDAEKIARLQAGELPIYEPGLEDLLRRNLEAGRLRFTTSFEEAAEFGDVHFVCVGTPQKQGEYAADVSYLDAVVDALAPHLTRECLVVGKSTVPVGTAARLAERLTRLAPAGEQVELVWNPEFLREGFAVADTLRPDRIVIGVASEKAEKIMREVYEPMLSDGVPLVVTDYPTAELVKSAANAFLATKISFINAMAEVCEAAHADVKQLSAALSYDERIGGKFLNPGLGFGGGCLPKDIRAFMARAGELGADQALSFLREVDAINMRRRARMVDLARELAGLLPRLRRRRARRRVQAELRRHPRLPRPRRRRHHPPPGRQRARVRPGRPGQRPPRPPRARLRGQRVRGGPRRARGAPAHRVA